MTIPKKLKVGGHIITVDASKDLGEDLNGDFDTEKLLIRISSALPKSMQGATLVHEVFHALNPAFDNDPIGHALLESLSEQWYQVLSDNNMLR